MKLQPNYYRDRVCLNVLAGSKANAQDIYAAAEGHVLVGVLSKNYPDVDSAVTDMLRYARLIENALSVGLGAGDPKQSAMVSLIAQQVQPQHVNQVFTGVGASRALLGQNDSVVNGLVSPTGRVGRLVQQLQHFNPRFFTVRQLPGDLLADVHAKQRCAQRRHHRQLIVAVFQRCRVNQRAHVLFIGVQIAKTHAAVHGHHVGRHFLRRQDFRAIQFVVQRGGDVGIGKGRLFQ